MKSTYIFPSLCPEQIGNITELGRHKLNLLEEKSRYLNLNIHETRIKTFQVIPLAEVIVHTIFLWTVPLKETHR